MRCLVCNAEMILMKVDQDDTMPVPGFERRTFMCSECHDVEQRLVFTKHAREGEPETVQVAPPIAGGQSNNEPIAGPLEPIREVRIHDEAFAASRLSMMRIMARRMNAATVIA